MAINESKRKASLANMLAASEGGGSNVAKKLREEHTSSETKEIVDQVELTYIDVRDVYAAPHDWNFYPSYSKQEKDELIESIKEKGVLDPIIVWEIEKEDVLDCYDSDELKNDLYGYKFKGERYMILAGHNRSDAALKAYDQTHDVKVLKIPARIIFRGDKENVIPLAKGVILDTNYHQRKKNEKILQQEIIRKCKYYEDQGNNKTQIVEKTAEDLNVSSRNIFRRLKLDKALPEIKEMFYNGVIYNKTCMELANLTETAQQYILDNYTPIMGTKDFAKAISKISYDTPIDEIDILMLSNDIKEKYVTIKTQVPESKVDSFEEMVKQWLIDNNVLE